MIIHEVEQNTVEWLTLRLGIPTASEFDRIVTPGGKFSKSSTSRAYALKLATEKLLNRPLDALEGLEWIERGKELEPQAVQAFEFIEEVKLRKVGFITSDDGRCGASPDMLIVGQNKGLEIKCPAPHTLMGYLVDGFETKYHVQRQGQIYVGELDAVVMYAWHPEMPPVKEEFPRDEPFQKLLAEALDQFTDLLAEIVVKAKSRGEFGAARIPVYEWEDYLRRLDQRSKVLDAG
jgi:hypothetical protein